MKIAITGKGGAGKSTLAAMLSLLAAKDGRKVLAVDADPDANLADALGIPRLEQQRVVTLARHRELVEERTGAKVKEFGQMFKLNPEVADIADKYAYPFRGVDLLVLGAVEGGGSGCACPESTLLRALVQNLVLYRQEAVILDMEAGIEHLGRATARGVDAFIAVVEPGQRSISTLHRIEAMAKEIGINRVLVVGNKVRTPEDQAFFREVLAGRELIGTIPYSALLGRNDRDGISVEDGLDEPLRGCFQEIFARIVSRTSPPKNP